MGERSSLREVRPKCHVCGKPAGPFGATMADFCACDQRNGATFSPYQQEQKLDLEILRLYDLSPSEGKES